MTLRKLRNDDSHGYDIPQFEDMYELFTENEEVFVSIRNSCKKQFLERFILTKGQKGDKSLG